MFDLSTLALKLNKIWRLFATGLSFSLFGLGGISVGLLFLIFVYPLPLNKNKKQQWTRNTISLAMAAYVRIMRFLGLLNFDIHTQANLNNSNQLIIANHPSLLDVVFLISMLRDTNCIVKGALWKNPFTFAPVRLAGYIRNDSETLLEDAAQAIKEGQRLIIFPEGTRNQHDLELKLKRGAANIATLAHCPITPVLIKCTPRTLQKNEPWYTIPKFPPLFKIQVLDALKIEDCMDIKAPRTMQVRQLTAFIGKFYRNHLTSF